MANRFTLHVPLTSESSYVHSRLVDVAQQLVRQGISCSVSAHDPEYELESEWTCSAAVNLKGEHIPCTQVEQMTTLDGSRPNGHDGWAHSNAEHEMIWKGEE